MEIGTDLKDFHLFSKPDKDGNRTAKDVFDNKIVEYLIDRMDLMIYNNVLYIYIGGVYVKDKDGRKIKSQIQALMYDGFKTSIRINRVYALLMCTNSLVATEEETNISDSVQEFVDEVITECPGMKPKKKDVFDYYEKYRAAEKLDSVGRNTFYQSMQSKGFLIGKSHGVEVFRNISISTQKIYLG